MELKYIITDTNSFVIFDKGQSHSKIARSLDGTPVGAGFCTIMSEGGSDYPNVHCYGQSITLKLKSRPEDEEVINRLLKIY